MSSCEDLLKAIDAYIAKADDDLKDALEVSGFVDPKGTVESIEALEEKLVKTLKAETGYLQAKLKNVTDLESFAADWLEIQAGNNVGEELAEIFLDEFQTQIPNLATTYIKQIDPGLNITQISQRTTAWAESWSVELGAMMKLSSHNDLEQLLVSHLADGKSVADLTQAFMQGGIRDEYYRARRAALTEMLRAHSVAAQEAITQNPSVDFKEWVHTGGYRNEPRPNHVKMSGTKVPKEQPFALDGADGVAYYPMHPRDSSLPASESVNCHCIHRGIANDSILGLSLEERQRLQQEAIAEDDGEWEKELDARNRARAGITETPVYKPRETSNNVSEEEKAIIGITTDSGAVVENIKPHFFDRMKERNIPLEGILDALQNPLDVTDVKVSRYGEPSVQYIGRRATVAYNPDTNTALTNWQTGQKRLKRYGVEVE